MIYGVLTRHCPEEITPLRTLESALLSRLGERLTGEPGAENVVRWNVIDAHVTYVTVWLVTEVLLVESPKVRVEFAGKDAFVAELLKT